MIGRSTYIIIKENAKIVFGQGAFPSVIFLLLVPQVYGISNLNSERVAECLGKMVALVGILLFVPILKPEQDSDIRDTILIKKLPYRIIILFRLVIATIASAVMISCFILFMVYEGCKLPIGVYTVRTVVVSMLLGGLGLLGSTLLKNTLAGFLLSFCCAFFFNENFIVMILEGINGFDITGGMILYSIILILCGITHFDMFKI